MKSMNASLDHLNLTVRSFKEAESWYKNLFGFETVETGVSQGGRPWGVLRSGDSMLCISEDEARANASDVDNDPAAERFHRIYHFGLRITDRTGWERILSSEKMKTFYDSPVHYPHSTSWYVTDPTGHMIEVVHWNSDAVSFAHAGLSS